MGRLRTMLAATAAAVLLAVAVMVAAPALGSGAAKPDGLVACLRAHGLAGAPTDATRLKPWLGERLKRGDVTAKRALLACAPPKPATAGPADAHLRACLKRHGAQIAGDDPAGLKRWIVTHAAARDALKACGVAPPDCAPAPGAAAKRESASARGRP